MVKDSPDIASALESFLEFAGNDTLMGYNVNFDINFLYDALLKNHDKILDNNFVDVMRFARKALPQLSDRKQTTVAKYYKISARGAHRALKDCEICNECYLNLMKEPAVIEYAALKAPKRKKKED